MSLIERIKEWYDGEFIVYKNEPDSSLFVIGGYQHYSTSAKIARWAVGHWLKHWQWWIGTILVIAGLVIAWLAWRHPQSSPISSYPITSKNEAVAGSPKESESKPPTPVLLEIPTVRFVPLDYGSEILKSQDKP